MIVSHCPKEPIRFSIWPIVPEIRGEELAHILKGMRDFWRKLMSLGQKGGETLVAFVVVNALQDVKDCGWSSSRWLVLDLVSSLTSVVLYLVVACARLDCPLWLFVVVPYHRGGLMLIENLRRPDWHSSSCLHLVVQIIFFPDILIASFISYLVLFPSTIPRIGPRSSSRTEGNFHAAGTAFRLEQTNTY